MAAWQPDESLLTGRWLLVHDSWLQAIRKQPAPTKPPGRKGSEKCEWLKPEDRKSELATAEDSQAARGGALPHLHVRTH